MAKELKVNDVVLGVSISKKELDAHLENYKKQNPAKYAQKETSGELDKLRASVK